MLYFLLSSSQDPWFIFISWFCIEIAAKTIEWPAFKRISSVLAEGNTYLENSSTSWNVSCWIGFNCFGWKQVHRAWEFGKEAINNGKHQVEAVLPNLGVLAYVVPSGVSEGSCPFKGIRDSGRGYWCHLLNSLQALTHANTSSCQGNMQRGVGEHRQPWRCLEGLWAPAETPSQGAVTPPWVDRTCYPSHPTMSG